MKKELLELLVMTSLTVYHIVWYITQGTDILKQTKIETLLLILVMSLTVYNIL